MASLLDQNYAYPNSLLWIFMSGNFAACTFAHLFKSFMPTGMGKGVAFKICLEPSTSKTFREAAVESELMWP